VTKAVIKAQVIQLWDLGKIYEAMGVRHNSHPTYLAHINVGFPSM
jgi:hypothetical protein